MANRSIRRIFFQLTPKHWIGFCLLIALLLVPLGLAVIGSGEAPPPLPPCAALPETGSAGEVSLFVGQDADKPGSICLRILNLSTRVLSYGFHSYILQTQGVRRIWSAKLIGMWPETDEEIVRIIPPGSHADDWHRFSPSHSWFFPQWYRACVRISFSGQSEETHRVCSQPFSSG